MLLCNQEFRQPGLYHSLITWWICQSGKLVFQFQSGFFTRISLPISQTSRLCNRPGMNLFIYLGFYVAFNTVQVISRRVVGRAEETSTCSSLGFCTVNCRPTARNYQLSHLRPCRESNPGLRGGRRECYHSATVPPPPGIKLLVHGGCVSRNPVGRFCNRLVEAIY